MNSIYLFYNSCLVHFWWIPSGGPRVLSWHFETEVSHAFHSKCFCRCKSICFITFQMPTHSTSFLVWLKSLVFCLFIYILRRGFFVVSFLSKVKLLFSDGAADVFFPVWIFASFSSLPFPASAVYFLFSSYHAKWGVIRWIWHCQSDSFVKMSFNLIQMCDQITHTQTYAQKHTRTPKNKQQIGCSSHCAAPLFLEWSW